MAEPSRVLEEIIRDNSLCSDVSKTNYNKYTFGYTSEVPVLRDTYISGFRFYRASPINDDPGFSIVQMISELYKLELQRTFNGTARAVRTSLTPPVKDDRQGVAFITYDVYCSSHTIGEIVDFLEWGKPVFSSYGLRMIDVTFAMDLGCGFRKVELEKYLRGDGFNVKISDNNRVSLTRDGVEYKICNRLAWSLEGSDSFTGNNISSWINSGDQKLHESIQKSLLHGFTLLGTIVPFQLRSPGYVQDLRERLLRSGFLLHTPIQLQWVAFAENLKSSALVIDVKTGDMILADWMNSLTGKIAGRRIKVGKDELAKFISRVAPHFSIATLNLVFLYNDRLTLRSYKKDNAFTYIYGDSKDPFSCCKSEKVLKEPSEMGLTDVQNIKLRIFETRPTVGSPPLCRLNMTDGNAFESVSRSFTTPIKPLSEAPNGEEVLVQCFKIVDGSYAMGTGRDAYWATPYLQSCMKRITFDHKDNYIYRPDCPYLLKFYKAGNIPTGLGGVQPIIKNIDFYLKPPATTALLPDYNPKPQLSIPANMLLPRTLYLVEGLRAFRQDGVLGYVVSINNIDYRSNRFLRRSLRNPPKTQFYLQTTVFRNARKNKKELHMYIFV